MNDAISRSAVLHRLEMLRWNYTLKAGFCDAMTDAIGEVRDAPALDAVPVVRCEICMNRRTFECPMYSETDGSDYGLDIIINDRTDDNGYCHCGARMDGEAE